jgi:type III secretory pathway component EscT
MSGGLERRNSTVSAPDYLDVLAQITAQSRLELVSLALAWARVTPSVILIPAFGLGAVPGPTRTAFALALAACIAPALRPLAETSTLPFGAAFGLEFVRGLPIAILASLALYAAGMAGGVGDNLRGSHEPAGLPNVGPDTTPLGALLVIVTSILFLESGGAIRIAQALAAPAHPLQGLLPALVLELTRSIEVAIAVAAPLVAASIVVELANALVARAASPAFILPLFAPLRSMALLAIAALVLDRMVELLALLATRRIG